jgi:hypothetical protein
MKLETDQQPVDNQSFKNFYKDQWNRVQYLADQFWVRWKKEFLQSLQRRSKWEKSSSPLKLNDVFSMMFVPFPFVGLLLFSLNS